MFCLAWKPVPRRRDELNFWGEKDVAWSVLHERVLSTGREHIYCNRPEEVLSWSSEAQQRLGYHLSQPNIGYTQDFLTPVQFMRGSKPEKLGDFDP